MTRPKATAALSFALFALTGCATARFLLGIKPPPGVDSRLHGLSRPEVVETGVSALLGEGNRIDGETPSFGLSQEDYDFLAFELFAPALDEPPTRAAVIEARDEYFEAVHPGEGLAESSELLPFFVVANPAARLAFIERLLDGHPRRAELLDKARWHAVEHDRVRFILFADPFHPTKIPMRVGHEAYSGLDSDPGGFSGVDDLWSIHTAGTDPFAVTNAAPVFLPARPPEERSIKDLAATAFLLSRIPADSAFHGRAQALLIRTSSSLLWKQAAASWNPEKGTFGPWNDHDSEVRKAVELLQRIPSDSLLFKGAQARIAQGKAYLAQSRKNAEAARREHEQRQRAFLASLSRDQRRVYDELGAPDENDPGPKGGRIWRYRDFVYADINGRNVAVAVRWKIYAFK